MKYYTGIDLGGTNIAAGVLDENGNILVKYSSKTNPNQPFESLVNDIADTAYRAIKDAKFEPSDISALGMGTPSCINPKNGLLVNANNLNWQNVPLVTEMQKHFDFPVYIQNDAACAALGEAVSGAAKGYDNAIMVTLGTGVGGGIIMNGRIFNGCDDMGAEIGHSKLVFDGERCTCGQYGCFEAYASATALIRQARKAAIKSPKSAINRLCGGNEEKITAEMAFDAAKMGDETAVKVVDRYIDYVAAGISSLVAVFRPQAVIIGGGVSHAGEYLITPLKEKLYRLTFSAEQIGIPFVTAAKLGNDAGLIGAAMLCRD